MLINTKPSLIDRSDLINNEITVEVITDNKIKTYKTTYGNTIDIFLKENNLKADDKLNITYTLQNHDVINLKNLNKISINQISSEELAKIPYISENNASDIIAYRNEHGLFKSLEDVKNVKGIGDSKLKILKEYLTL